MRDTRAALVLSLFVIGPVAFAAPLRPSGGATLRHAFEDRGTGVRPGRAASAPGPRSAAPAAARGAALYPLYGWPLADALLDSVEIVNYVDEDPGAGILDYEGGDWTYDTHRGTDIALMDFRSMDRGMRIVSGAPGEVTNVVYGNRRDRNCTIPDDATLNFIEIANGDGTYTYYDHLRANSATVNAGESVAAGDPIGLVGSSGHSTGPHLHFEPGDYLDGYEWRDPWAGPYNPNPGLWQQQEPWAGSQHLHVFDLGVTTQTAAGGDLGAIDYCACVAEHLEQPVVFGLDEPYLPVWFTLQGLAGDAYHIDVRRPDQTVYASVDATLPADVHGGYQYWYWSWSGFVSPDDEGLWTARLTIAGEPVRQTSFTVGPLTRFGPRFAPGVGRSFRVDGTVQSETLRVTPLGGPVTYALVGAPSSVTLSDSVITVDASSTQPARSAYLAAIATDAGGLQDTAWIHVVDPSKPRQTTAAAEDPAPIQPALIAGSPFSGSTRIRYALARQGRVTLSVHDLAGRQVRVLFDGIHPAGRGTAGWDGRDRDGRSMGAGVYFVRLAGAGPPLTCRVVRLR